MFVLVWPVLDWQTSSGIGGGPQRGVNNVLEWTGPQEESLGVLSLGGGHISTRNLVIHLFSLL